MDDNSNYLPLSQEEIEEGLAAATIQARERMIQQLRDILENWNRTYLEKGKGKAKQEPEPSITSTPIAATTSTPITATTPDPNAPDTSESIMAEYRAMTAEEREEE